MSIFEPNPPPVAEGSTRMRSNGMAKMGAKASLSITGAWVQP